MMNLKQLRDGLLLVEDLNYGAMIKQGDKTLLRFKLINQRNPDESIVNKDVTVRVMRDFQTLNYEKTVKVKAENVVEFSIDNPLRAGRYYIEFKVGDAIYPSDHRFYFDVTPSGDGQEVNIIEIVGVDTIVNKVLDKVDTDVSQAITNLTTTNQTVQEAEAQRVIAESARVSTEAQRKIDHANRSAELDGKADKVVIKNLLPLSFRQSSATYVLNNDVIEVSLNPPYTGIGGVYRTISNIPIGNKVLVSAKYMVEKPVNASIGNNRDKLVVPLTKTNEWERVTIITASTTSSAYVFYIDNQKPPVLESYKLTEPQIIDLTETFGAGNEPTQEEMDRLIEVIGYIDGEYALNNKEMLIWTLSLIRRNKNAIVALGGA